MGIQSQSQPYSSAIILLIFQGYQQLINASSQTSVFWKVSVEFMGPKGHHLQENSFLSAEPNPVPRTEEPLPRTPLLQDTPTEAPLLSLTLPVSVSILLNHLPGHATFPLVSLAHLPFMFKFNKGAMED